VKNAPFGTYGDQAQFQMGEVYKAQAEFEEAQKAFQTVVDEYPNSDLVTKARYQIAYCSMQASKKAQYNEQYAQRAIEEFEGFKQNFPTDQQAVEADEAIKTLRAKKALTYLETARFYEKQGKNKSAQVYYGEIVNKYPDSPYFTEAKQKFDQIVTRESEPEKQGGSWLPKLPKVKMPKLW